MTPTASRNCYDDADAVVWSTQPMIPIYPRSLAQAVGMISAAVTYLTLTRLHVRRAQR